MAVARVAREAKTSSPARRTNRERRGGAAIAAERRGSESSSDLTEAEGWRRLLFAVGASHRGVRDLGLGSYAGQCQSGPT